LVVVVEAVMLVQETVVAQGLTVSLALLHQTVVAVVLTVQVVVMAVQVVEQEFIQKLVKAEQELLDKEITAVLPFHQLQVQVVVAGLVQLAVTVATLVEDMLLVLEVQVLLHQLLVVQ
jgi:hypothetical protein